MGSSISLPPGIVVFERGWLSSNNILAVGERGTALVDSGYCTHASQTIALVERELGQRPLDLLLNTHLHSDHCGGNAALQARYPSLQTLIPPGHADAVRIWDGSELSYEATGQQCPRFSFGATLSPGGEVALGDTLWQIHAAPGHDPHSVILFEPRSRTIISADALWQDGFGVVFPELAGEPGFDDVAATLDLIESLDPAAVIPGHGPPFDNVEAALVSARSRLAAYRGDPRRHSVHAMKVLLKFKLLELHDAPMAEFAAWAMGTPYFKVVFARYFREGDAAGFLAELVEGLIRAKAAAVVDGSIISI